MSKIIDVTYWQRDHEKYSLKVKRPVLEDKGKYITLSQLVSKIHHECIMNESCLYHVTFEAWKKTTPCKSAIAYFLIIMKIKNKDIRKKHDLSLTCKWNLLRANYAHVHHAVARIERILWFQGWVHFCHLALIALPIFAWFSNIRCQSLILGFFYKTKHISLIYLVSKWNKAYTKLYTFLRHPVFMAHCPPRWFQVLEIPTNFAGPLYWSFWASRTVSKFKICC